MNNSGGKKFIDFNSPKFIQIEINWHQLFKKVNLFEFSKLLNDYEIFKILPHGKKFDFYRSNKTRK